jgi:hypothetical protein
MGTVSIVKKSGNSIDIKGRISRSEDSEVRSIWQLVLLSNLTQLVRKQYQRLRATGKKPKVAL